MAKEFTEDKIYGLFWRGDFDNYYLGHQGEEILKARIYAPYLEDKKAAVVIDAGGNIGLFSLYASKYSKVVYCLEPAEEQFQLISHMVLNNELTNVIPIRKALYIENKEFPLYHNPNKTMNSLHAAVADKNMQPEMVWAITLDKFFEEQNIEHCDLFKIDIEGSEFEVLCSESFAKVASKIDTVIGETHSWGGRNPQQLIDAFKENGFEYNTIQGDATLFVASKKKVLGKKV